MENLVKVTSNMLNTNVFESFIDADAVSYNDELGAYECEQEELDWWLNQSNYAYQLDKLADEGFDFNEFFMEHGMRNFENDWEKLVLTIEYELDEALMELKVVDKYMIVEKYKK